MPLYFAYGSNMDEWQMRQRCPGAKFKFVAKMERWRLCFPRFSKKRCGGVASIEQAEGETVWGVVFEIPDAELPLLDKSEGYDPKRPSNKNSYNRVEMQVTDTGGERHKCHVYVANADKPYRPSRDCYLNYIIRGAEEHQARGIPASYIQELKKIKAQDD